MRLLRGWRTKVQVGALQRFAQRTVGLKAARPIERRNMGFRTCRCDQLSLFMCRETRQLIKQGIESVLRLGIEEPSLGSDTAFEITPHTLIATVVRITFVVIRLGVERVFVANFRVLEVRMPFFKDQPDVFCRPNVKVRGFGYRLDDWPTLSLPFPDAVPRSSNIELGGFGRGLPIMRCKCGVYSISKVANSRCSAVVAAIVARSLIGAVFDRCAEVWFSDTRCTDARHSHQAGTVRPRINPGGRDRPGPMARKGGLWRSCLL